MHKVDTSSPKTEAVLNATGSITSCVSKTRGVPTVSNGNTEEPQQHLKEAMRRAARQEWNEKGQTVDEVNQGRHMNHNPSRAVRDQEEPDKTYIATTISRNNRAGPLRR